MRLGLWPGQRRLLAKALKKAAKFDHFRQRTRRGFLAVGAFGLGASVAAFFCGRATVAASAADRTGAEKSQPEALDWLREITVGPITELRSQAMHVVAALERAAPNDPLWVGFHRLCAYSLVHPEDQALRHRLAGLARMSTVEHAREAGARLSFGR